MTRIIISTNAIILALGFVFTVFLGFPIFGQESNESIRTAEVATGQPQPTIDELNNRLTTIETNVTQASLFNWLTLGVAVVAALSGAWLGGYLSKSAALQAENRAFDLRRKEATVSFCAQWIELAGTIASVTLTLENANSQIESRKLNEISTYGNWLEMVLLMKSDGMLDEKFLEKFTFRDKVIRFRDKVESARNADSRLGDYLNAWPQISNI